MFQQADQLTKRPGAQTKHPPLADVATVLSRMTFAERVRAYRSGVFSRHELAVAAAREPERMPVLNGEFEWISVSLVDLE